MVAASSAARRDLLAMEFGQAVDRLGEQLGRRMIELVPARIVGRVVEAEVRSHVQQRGTARTDLAGHAGGHAVWQRREDGVGHGDGLVDDEARGAEARM